jgi:hypothetical protein
LGGEHHGHNWSLPFVGNFHGPLSKIERTVLEKGNKLHHATSKTYRYVVCSDRIINVATDVVGKVFARSGQVKVEVCHNHGFIPQAQHRN